MWHADDQRPPLSVEVSVSVVCVQSIAACVVCDMLMTSVHHWVLRCLYQSCVHDKNSVVDAGQQRFSSWQSPLIAGTAGTRNSSMSPPHEGSIRWPIAPWENALTTELHLAPTEGTNAQRCTREGKERDVAPWWERSLMVRWIVRSILHGVDSLSYFLLEVGEREKRV